MAAHAGTAGLPAARNMRESRKVPEAIARKGSFTGIPHSGNTSRKPATFQPMVHRIYPILSGLALALALLALPAAAAQSGDAAEYSGAGASGPASRGASASSPREQGRMRMAQQASEDSRAQLRMELDCIRRQNAGDSRLSRSFDPPVPVRKRPSPSRRRRGRRIQPVRS